MSKIKSIIWGFENEITCEGIQALNLDGAIDIKFWFGEKKNSNYVTHDCFDFQGSAKGLIDKNYGNCDYKVYQHVYQKIITFMDMSSRSHQVRPMPHYEYINYLRLTVDFFSFILQNSSIELILFANIPHEGPDYILYEIAQYKCVKTLITTQSLFPNRYFCVPDIEDYGKFERARINNAYEEIQVDGYFEKDLFYMKPRKKNKINAIKDFIRNPRYKIRILKMTIKLLTNNLLHAAMHLELYLKEQAHIKNNKTFEKNISIPESSFIYFPLHLQPEMTTSPLGREYCDQLLAIEKIAAKLPPNWKIIVKENPKQGFYYREKLFYKRLASIPNTVLVSGINTYELIRKCKFVATISGTAGWEAISGGKNVLVFGCAWYQTLPGVFRFNDEINLLKIAENSFQAPELISQLNNLLSRTCKGVVDKDYAVQVPSFNKSDNNKLIELQLRGLIESQFSS